MLSSFKMNTLYMNRKKTDFTSIPNIFRFFKNFTQQSQLMLFIFFKLKCKPSHKFTLSRDFLGRLESMLGLVKIFIKYKNEEIKRR